MRLQEDVQRGPVTVSVDDEGFNHVVPGGNHRILVLTGEQAGALKDFEVEWVKRNNN